MRLLKSFSLGLALLWLSPVHAAEIKIDGGNVVFSAPEGFTPLSQEEIAAIYPQRMGPMEAVGNEVRDVCISNTITDIRVRPGQLAELKTTLATSMEQLVPGLQWIKNDFIEINGTRWIVFEFMTSAGERKIHNLEIATSYRQRVLLINCSASADVFTTEADPLWVSLKSVKIVTETGGTALLGGGAPKSAAEFVARAKMELGYGDLEPAEASFRAAMAASPELADAKIGLGRINAARENYNQALTNFSEAIADDRQSAEAYSLRSLVKAEMGEFDQAIADAEKACSLKPDDTRYVCARGNIELAQGDSNSAWNDYQHALVLNQTNTGAHGGLGRIRLFRGDYEAALLDFQAATLNQNEPDTYTNLGLLSILTGKPDVALREFQNVTEVTHDPNVVGWARLQIWAIEAERGHADAATRDLATFLQTNTAPRNGQARTLGDYLTGKTSEADAIEMAKSDNPYQTKFRQCRAWYLVGIKRHADGDEPGALEAFRQCLATGMKSSDAYLLARSHLSPAEVDAAENGVKDALPILEGLGRRYYSVGLWIIGGGAFIGLVVIAIVIVFYSQSKPRGRAPVEIKRAPRLK